LSPVPHIVTGRLALKLRFFLFAPIVSGPPTLKCARPRLLPLLFPFFTPWLERGRSALLLNDHPIALPAGTGFPFHKLLAG